MTKTGEEKTTQYVRELFLEHARKIIGEIICNANILAYIYYPRSHGYDICQLPKRLGQMPLHGENFPDELMPYLHLTETDEARLRAAVCSVDEGAPATGLDLEMHLGGKSTWVTMRWLNIFNADGQPEFTFGFAFDITAEKNRAKNFADQILINRAARKAILTSTCFNVTKDILLRYSGSVSETALPSEPPCSEEIREEILAAEPCVAQQSPETQYILLSAAANIPDPAKRLKLVRMSSRCALLEAFQKGLTEQHLEYDRLVEGKMRYVSTKVITIADPETQDVYAFFYTSDITSRRQNEMVIDTVMRQSCDFVAVLDPEEDSALFMFQSDIIKRIVPRWNSSEKISYSKELKFAIQKLIPTEKQEELLQAADMRHVMQELEQKDSYVFSYDVQELDRRVYKQVVYRWLDPARSKMLALQQDVTTTWLKEQERLRAEAKKDQEIKERQEAARKALADKNLELEHSRDELAETTNIIAGAGFGIWYITLPKDGHPCITGNAKFLEVMGVHEGEFTPEGLYDYWYSRILKEDLPSVKQSVASMLEGKLSENTYRWLHPKKGLTYVRCGGSVKTNEPDLQVLCGYHSDVTHIVGQEQKQKEALSRALKAAEQASRSKTTFLSNMSHDIRTPMNAIVGFASIAAAHPDDKEKVQDCLQKILLSSNHLQKLINDILDMSHIESGKFSLNIKRCSLSEIVHSIMPVLQPQIASKHHRFELETSNVRNEYVYADVLKLNQIMLNLVGNAVKYTPSGGTITIRIEQHPSEKPGWANYIFSIKDTGIGMSHEFMEHAFQPFEREATSTVSGIEGTGLGLTIAKNIIGIMGGTITVESEPGRGSEFVVTLELQLQEDICPDYHIEQLKGCRALVVDDDYTSCHSISKMLGEMGLRPDWTASSREALSRARTACSTNDPYEVFIIDWAMPDINGLDLVRRLRGELGANVPIIIITAYDWSDIAAEAKEAGVAAFCTKPIFMSDLKNSLLESIGATEGTENTSEPLNVRIPDNRLLVVDDNELNREITVAVLEEIGFKVDTASDGAKAVEMLSNSLPGYYALVLMDVQMPVMDGYEATREIRCSEREDISSLPVIAMTANAFEEDKKRAVSSGMNAHIAKPLDVPILIETIRKFLK